MKKAAMLFLLFVPGLMLAKDNKDVRGLTVTAVSHSAQYTDSNNHFIHCTGNNCNIYGGFQWVDVTQVVDAEGMRYTLTCSGVPFRSAVYRKCSWLSFDGDSFPAQIKGKEMTIEAREGGNQGKLTKMRFKIADIRSIPST